MTPHPAQRRRRRSGISRSGWAALLSVAGHLLFVLLLLLLSYVELRLPGGQKPKRAPERPISMWPLASSQWAKNRGPNAPEQPSRPAPPKRPVEKKKQEEHPKGQVVDVQPGNQQESPDAQYLAETSNKVKRESKAKEQTPNYRNAMPRKTTTTPQQGEGHDEAERAQISGNNGVGHDDAPRREAGKNKQSLEIPSSHAQQEIALRPPTAPQGQGLNVNKQGESEEIQGNSQRLKIAPGGADGEEASAGRMGEPGVPNLVPSASVLDKLSGAAPNDHLEDVDEGNGTYLNTKEWKYASFFNRVKQSVGLQWNPAMTLRQRDPSGQIYGGKDRFTLLTITLTPNGRVKEVYVEKSSGLDFLDLEAVRSFERAQPFPNPPPGLLAADSTVKFSFGFFVEMGGGPRMRLFRSNN